MLLINQSVGILSNLSQYELKSLKERECIIRDNNKNKEKIEKSCKDQFLKGIIF